MFKQDTEVHSVKAENIYSQRTNQTAD